MHPPYTPPSQVSGQLARFKTAREGGADTEGDWSDGSALFLKQQLWMARVEGSIQAKIARTHARTPTPTHTHRTHRTHAHAPHIYTHTHTCTPSAAQSRPCPTPFALAWVPAQVKSESATDVKVVTSELRWMEEKYAALTIEMQASGVVVATAIADLEDSEQEAMTALVESAANADLEGGSQAEVNEVVQGDAGGEDGAAVVVVAAPSSVAEAEGDVQRWIRCAVQQAPSMNGSPMSDIMPYSSIERDILLLQSLQGAPPSPERSSSSEKDVRAAPGGLPAGSDDGAAKGAARWRRSSTERKKSSWSGLSVKRLFEWWRPRVFEVKY